VLLIATLAIYFGTGSYVSKKYLLPALQERQAQRAAPTDVSAPAPLASSPAVAEAAAAPEPAATEAAQAAGPAPVWTIAGGKKLAFSLSNGGAEIGGSFGEWSGSIKMDPDHPESADIGMTIKLASATVGDPTQNAMLQGAEFFATSANPVATWRSTKVTQTSSGHYRASGTLTIKGKSRPQAVAFTLGGTGLKRHVTGSAGIDRAAFGIGTGEASESLSKQVSLSFAFDAVGGAPAARP